MIWRSFLLTRFVLFFIFTCQSFAHANIAVEKPVQTLSTNLTQADRRMARELHQFLRELRNRRISTAQTTQLLSLAKTSFAFQDLTPVLQIAHDVSRIQGRSSLFFDNCGVLTSNNSIENQVFLAERLISDVQSYCRHQFWDMIHTNKLSSKFDERSLEYFRSIISNALSGEHQSLFDLAMIKILAHQEQKKNLFIIIEEVLITNNIVPHANLLKLIDISPRLTAYIQNNSGLDTQSNRVFRDHVRDAITEIRGDIDRDNFNELKTKLVNLTDFYQKNSSFLHQNYVWTNMSSLGRRLLYKKTI
jgi:hypothetical protein